MSKLPMGWAAATLNDLLGADGLFSDGDWVESKDQDPDGANRLLQLADIGDGLFIDKSSRYVNDEKFSILNCTELKEGDVLIARMPDPLGRACLLPIMAQRCLTVVDVAVFRVGSTGISNKWLMHLLNSSPVRHEMELNSSGTTRKRISRGRLGEILLPVPPMAEQIRIAAKLDELMAQVDTLKTRIDGIPALLKRFRQSVLAAAVSGRLTEEWRTLQEQKIEWKELSIDSVCASSFYGPRFGKGDYVTDGLPTIRTTDMTPKGEILITNTTPRVNVPKEKIEHFKVCNGDLLVTRTGSIGTMAVFRGNYEAIPSAYLIRFRFKESVSVDFIYTYLTSPEGQEKLGLGTTTTTQPNINAQTIRGIMLNLPSINEQTEIVRHVDQLFAFADQLEAKVSSAKSRIDQLTQSILAKAFRGELVPQDPNDEPASALLKRIKTQRTAAPKTKHRRRAATPS
ncbi:restriction endonuclease subunit S [Pseudomonas fulva]|uniref:restriction endonuclease subunit S n=1 Tax=Pseudomonas fulva TaxID=47880 RepID=UPI002449E422|nr:restriction endonuclease subunit S [Pseudomonas fulva]MDH0621171.1 restriction endonuclease subunit S [Pseudomonas fulva]